MRQRLLEAAQATGKDAQLAQLQTQTEDQAREIESLRESLAESQEKCESLTVERIDFEELKAECARLTHELSGARTARDIARRACETAIAARDLAVAAQQQAEQNEDHLKLHLKAEYMRLIDPLSAALRALTGVSGIDAREQRYVLERLLEEFRRLHTQAMNRPVPFTPTPIKSHVANPEKLAQAIESKTEQDRLENLRQPRAMEPLGVEHMREKTTPRAPEPEPTKPISGAQDFADWV